MYIMLSAIFDVLEKRNFGIEKHVFLIVFGVDRKSLWRYIYKHLSDFEGLEIIHSSYFFKRRFWTFFLLRAAKWPQNAYTSVKWDPPSKNVDSKKDTFREGPGVPKTASFRACPGGPNRPRMLTRLSNDASWAILLKQNS